MRYSSPLKPLAILVAFGVACAGPNNAIRLDKTKSFPASQQKAASAVLKEIKAKDGDPRKFYAEVHQNPDGSLLFRLWGSENFHLLQSGKPVNPGGGLDIKVDSQSGQILETLYWQ